MGGKKIQWRQLSQAKDGQLNSFAKKNVNREHVRTKLTIYKINDMAAHACILSLPLVRRVISFYHELNLFH